MQAQVKEWGNNQETRLSKDIRKSAGIELNENLDVSVANGVITLMKPFHHKTLEENMTGVILCYKQFKFRTASYMDKR